MVVTLSTDATVRLTQLIGASEYDLHDIGYTVFVLNRDGRLDRVVSQDGDVNEAALSRSLADLARDRPYLLKNPRDSRPERPPTGASGGNVGTHSRGRFSSAPNEAYVKKKYRI